MYIKLQYNTYGAAPANTRCLAVCSPFNLNKQKYHYSSCSNLIVGASITMPPLLPLIVLCCAPT